MAIGNLRGIGSLACLKGDCSYKRIRVKIKGSKIHVVTSSFHACDCSFLTFVLHPDSLDRPPADLVFMAA